MKTFRVVAAVLLFFVGVGVWVLRSREKVHAAQLGACVSYVPREWGPFRGGSAQAGLAFEDSAGTLRFVTNLPCNATPVVALEVRRAPASNF